MSQEEVKQRIAKSAPLARKVLKLLTEKCDELPFGGSEAMATAITPVTKEVLALCLADNINWVDGSFVMRLLLQPISKIMEQIDTSQQINWSKANDKKWGKNTLDVTFKEVDDVLKEA